jgi:hypothetical protein
MALPFETIKLNFGIHKGKEVKDVPDDYLKFLLSKKKVSGKMLFHCQVRFNLPKKTFLVTVTDSIATDGTYKVQAYNRKHAMSVCRREHNIQNTQSEHGTEYWIVEAKTT